MSSSSSVGVVHLVVRASGLVDLAPGRARGRARGLDIAGHGFLGDILYLYCTVLFVFKLIGKQLDDIIEEDI